MHSLVPTCPVLYLVFMRYEYLGYMIIFSNITTINIALLKISLTTGSVGPGDQPQGLWT